MNASFCERACHLVRALHEIMVPFLDRVVADVNANRRLFLAPENR